MATIPPSAAGSVRVVSKRKGGTMPAPGETIIDCDRADPVLGNPHILHNHNDANERARVLEAHAKDFERDMAAEGPIFRRLVNLADRVRSGERLALRCWCAPRPCHVDRYRTKILDLAGLTPSQGADDEVELGPRRPRQPSLF